jgi:protein-disulfide isomerase
MNKRFVALLTILVLGIFGAAIYSSKKNSTNTRRVANPKMIQTDDHVIGKADSKVYLIIYGDYECPACKAWEPSVVEIRDEYKDRVAFIFRNYPIQDKHLNARAAANAAEAANLQGKFWEMHDLLYAKYSEWTNASTLQQDRFEGYANQLGLNMDQFKKDYASTAVADHIDSDKNSGDDLGVDGTPTFFLNGEKINLPLPGSGGKEQMKSLIEAKLEEPGA